MSTPVRAPDLAELETLVACAAEGSLVGAAARIGISRPAVAKRIANLEALAGRALLHRGGRGVRLTEAGAELLASARRVLAERDDLVAALSALRGEIASPIAGVRDMLGHTSVAARAAQQPEARLAETERVLALVLRASATGVVISEPGSGIVHEVNEAFCSFTGRPREVLVGHSATANDTWYDLADRARLVEAVQRDGVAEGILVRARRPDGTVAIGRAGAQLVDLAGGRRLLATVDDITEERRLDAARLATAAAYRAVTQAAGRLVAGQPVAGALAAALPPLRAAGGFGAAALVGVAGLVAADGDRPPPDRLAGEIVRARPLSRTEAVARIGDGRTLGGLATRLPAAGLTLVLASPEPIDPPTEALFAGVLTDLAELVARAA